MAITDNNDDIGKAIQGYQDLAKKGGFSLNSDRQAVTRIARGLLENEKKYGFRYCPCRRVTNNPAEDKKIICPCEFHLAEIKKYGHCLCGLFTK